MKTKSITLPYSHGCYHATAEQAAELFTAEQIAAGEVRFEITTAGPWQLLRSVRGLVSTTEDVPTGNSAPCLTSTPISITFHGMRTLSRPRPNGYGITGSMRFAGRSARVIDCNPLVQIAGGKYVSVATLHLCV